MSDNLDIQFNEIILYNNSKIEMIYSANYRTNNIDFNFELVK